MTRTQAIQNVVQAAIATATIRFDAGDEMLDDGATVFMNGRETNINLQYSGRTVIVHLWNDAEKAQYHKYRGTSIEAAGATIIDLLREI